MDNRDNILREQIDAIAVEATDGDDSYIGCKWGTLRIVHSDELSFVEAGSDPTTSYTRHIFAVRWDTGCDRPTLIGEYVGDGNQWSLIAASPDAPAGWQELFPADQFKVSLPNVASDQRTRLIQEGFPDRFEEILCGIICSYGFDEDDDGYETVKRKLSWKIINCVHVAEYTYLHIDSGHSYPQFVIVVQFKEDGEPWILGYFEQSGFQRRWKLRESNTDDREWELNFPVSELGTVGTDWMLMGLGSLIFFSPFYLAFLVWLWWFSEFGVAWSIMLSVLPPPLVVLLSVMQGKEESRQSGPALPDVLEWKQRDDPRAVRRVTLGIGVGVVLVLTEIVLFLSFVWSGREDVLDHPLVLAFLIACPFAAVASVCSAVSWALLYRCPECKQTILREWNSYGRNYGKSLVSLRYFCHDCGVEWRIFWPENDGVGQMDRSCESE